MRQAALTLSKMVIKTLKELSETEINHLLNGRGKLVLAEVKQSKQVIDKIDEDSLFTIKQQVQTINTREEMVLYLKAMTKRVLIRLAYNYNIPTLKSDTKERLIKKITENLIGIKIRFQLLEK